jgi:hypothetical protein
MLLADECQRRGRLWSLQQLGELHGLCAERCYSNMQRRQLWL